MPTLLQQFHIFVYCHTSDLQESLNTLESIKMTDMPVRFQLPATSYNKAKLYEISGQGLRSLKQRSACESSCFCWLNDEVKVQAVDRIRYAYRTSIIFITTATCRSSMPMQDYWLFM